MRWVSNSRFGYLAGILPVLVLLTMPGRHAPTRPGPGPRPGVESQILRGRYLVISHACNGCHGGVDPADPRWLSGSRGPDDEFHEGACSFSNPTAKPCFVTRPRNLTPDNATGLGRFSERQIFNALRFGLRPENTPDVEITSTTPGQGNFPEHPHYLGPPMPWPAWRHMPDEDLWAIAAYLKRAVKPVTNKVADSDGPPDFWASGVKPEKIGRYPAPPFPTANELPEREAGATPGR